MVGGGAPEYVELVFAFKVDPDEIVQAFPVVGLNRLRIECGSIAVLGSRQARLVLMQAVKKYTHVVHSPHGILIIVHAVKMGLRIIPQERLDGFDHVTELLESDPHMMDRDRVVCIQLSKHLAGLRMCLIHGP